MRFFLYAFLYVISISSNTLFAQSETEPVLHLEFNGTVSDLTGQNNSIIIEGGAFVEDRDGNANHAYHFDGDDYITIEDSNSSIDEISNSSGITFMAWIKNEGFVGHMSRSIIIERYDDFDEDYWKSTGYHFGINNSGQIHITGRYSSNFNELYEYNKWIHIAVTIKDNKVKFYVNGYLRQVANKQFLSASESDITIGGSMFSDQDFVGALDDLRMYDHEVDYNVIREAAGLDPIVDDRIFFMTFNGAIADSSKFEFELYENPELGKADGEYVSDRFGEGESAYNFRGTEHAISLNSREFYNQFRYNDTFSISVWLYLEEYPEQNSTILEIPYQADQHERGFSLQIDKFGKLGFYTGTKYSIRESELLQNQWVHIAIVYHENEMKLFINGNEDKNIFERKVYGEISGVSSALFIGGSSSHSTGSYNESMDDVAIYNYALSENEIQSLVDFEHEINVPFTKLLHLPFHNSFEDKSEIENNIEFSGGSLGFDRFGEAQQALYLKGEDHVKINDTNSRLDSIYNELTFASWIYVNEFLPDNNYLLSRVDQEFADKLEFIIKKYSSTGSIDLRINSKVVTVSTIDLTVGEWMHIAFTYDGELIKIFLNGKMIRSVQYSTSLSLTNSDLYLGGKQNYSGFYGAFDELQLYNRALEDSTIEAIYDINKEGRIYEEEEIVYLPFNGSSADSSHNQNPVDVFGAELTTGRFENENQAYLFEDDNDVIKVKDLSSELDSVYSGITMNVWVKLNEMRKSMMLVQRKDTAHEEFSLGIYGNNISFKINGAESRPIIFSDDKLKRNTWYMFTGTFDDSMLRLYKNGELVHEGNYSGKIKLHESDISIGNSLDMSKPLKGAIDEVRILNYALDETQISAEYENRFKGYDVEPKEVLHLSFENNLVDSSSSQHTIINQGGSFTEDRLGNPSSAYSFNGTDTRLVIEDNNSSLDSITVGFTLAAWVKMDDVGEDFPQSTIISRSDDAFDHYYLGIIDGHSDEWSNDFLHPKIDGLLFQIDDVEWKIKDQPVQPGQWFHVAGTFDGENVSFYLNGEMTRTTKYEGIMRVSESDLFIGNNALGDQPFSGAIDEIRIYNYALSEEDISAFIDVETLPVPVEHKPEIPSEFSLFQNYPNPFNPTTQIRFQLPSAGEISLKIFNSIGHEVATIKNGYLNSGVHSVTFIGNQLSSGVYFYQLKFKNEILTKKMLLIK